MYQKQTPLLSSFAFPFRNLIAHRSELTDNHRWSFSFTKLGLLRSFSVRWESFRVYFSFLISFSSLRYFIIVESSILSPSTLFASILFDTVRCHGFPRFLPRYSSHSVFMCVYVRTRSTSSVRPCMLDLVVPHTRASCSLHACFELCLQIKWPSLQSIARASRKPDHLCPLERCR